MTQYTESDLRTVFEEYSAEGPRRPAYLEEITRRGRAARRRRRVTVGAVLAGAAVATAGVAGASGLYDGRSAPGPASAARVTNGITPPATVVDMKGETLGLIRSERHTTVGQGVKVTFQPTTYNTGYSIRCADPEVFVLVKHGNEAALARCGRRHGPGLDSQYDWQSAGPGWLGKRQTLEIWLFPADAPIGRRTDDGLFDMAVVVQEPDRLAKVVGHHPSEWTIGVYDKPAGFR
ncbi:hypothetical protein [Sphaerisporangium fuscum]|uniref:hypothetical protein n=1 Tax=Sphaerisporangium fuscum TaxID=2835868 RepID=UPI001BDC2CAE|nr:hypothetical protein [Sphaerisporangium fuscum]